MDTLERYDLNSYTEFIQAHAHAHALLLILKGLPVIAIGVGLSTYDAASVRCFLTLQAMNI